MALSLQNFSGLVQSMAAAAQGACSKLLDFTVGSVLRAITEATASQGLWMQWLIVLVMNRTRLATSFGADVDSFVADFGMSRLPGVASTGTVTLSRFYATSPATVLVGSVVRTGDGSQSFNIIADSTNSLWNAALTDPSGTVVGGYIIPANTTTADFKVQNQVVGTVGNVSASTVTLLASAISGVDTVNNALAFTNGLDAETDAALKSRFQNYINSLSKATEAAIASAIAGVQQGLTCNIAANKDTDGSDKPGKFVVTIDDGTGSPPSDLLTRVSDAIQPVRSLCETYAVQAPTVVDAAIVLTIDVASGYVKANLQGPVATAISAYVNALPIGTKLPYSRISQIAYGVSPGISNVHAITINSETADIVPTSSGVVKASPSPVVN